MDEYAELKARVDDLNDILAKPSVSAIISTELSEIVSSAAKYRTRILPSARMSMGAVIPERGRRRHHHPRQLRQARTDNPPFAEARRQRRARHPAAAATTWSNTSSSRPRTTNFAVLHQPRPRLRAREGPTGYPEGGRDRQGPAYTLTCWPSSPTSFISASPRDHLRGRRATWSHSPLAAW